MRVFLAAILRALAIVMVVPLVSCPFIPRGVAADRPPPHQWIVDEPGYLAKHAPSQHCCGPEHCKPVSESFAKPEALGWRVVETGELFAWGEIGFYHSADTETGGRTMWACVWGNATQCLFVPGRTM